MVLCVNLFKTKDLSNSLICKSMQAFPEGEWSVVIYHRAVIEVWYNQWLYETLPYWLRCAMFNEPLTVECLVDPFCHLVYLRFPWEGIIQNDTEADNLIDKFCLIPRVVNCDLQCLLVFEKLDGVWCSKDNCFHFLRIECQIIKFRPLCNHSSMVRKHPDAHFHFRFGSWHLNI